ncbi:MAG: hypothetical protein KDA55_03420 [Planctomycetales bacterium]|nr:hypothetical protein [Planctomycetales bacterium]
MLIDLADGWHAELDRGPDWLFVRLSGLQRGGGNVSLADAIWQLLQQNLAHRLVLELDDLPILPSHVIGELVKLHKRINTEGGLMRICGLSDECQSVCRMNRLDARFPHYGSRHDAVMGHYPAKPR